MEQEYIITVFSENKVGLLSQITTVFTCRNVNIESLTTSESALAGIHKFTIVVRTGPDRVEKLARQVEKKIDVLKVFVYTSDEVVQQEIALYKVTRSRNVEKLVREHNVRILEIDDDYIRYVSQILGEGETVTCYVSYAYVEQDGRYFQAKVYSEDTSLGNAYCADLTTGESLM